MADNSEPRETSDENLVARSRQGDKACFGVLVERYWNMAVAMAMTKTKNLSHAEDIAQEGFLRAYMYLHTLKKPSRFAGWLGSIVLREVANSGRRARRERQVSISTVPEVLNRPVAHVGGNPGLTERHRAVIREAVGRLPEKYQAVVIMRFVTGMPATRIAEQLGMRAGTVRMWLHRACQTLRKEIPPLLEEVDLS
jgi:RNA polymerase sigma-70 factor (ECF subfamily)